MDKPRYFAEVLLPLPLPGMFTYAVPDSLVDNAEPGQRVIVPFGARKQYTGIICRIHTDVPESEVKLIISIPDNRPVVNTVQLKHWEWIADYYICTPGEVMRAALPSALKIESRTEEVFRDIKHKNINPHVGFNTNLRSEQAINKLFDSLSRSPVQKSLVEKLLVILGNNATGTIKEQYILHGVAAQNELVTSDAERLALRNLCKKEILYIEDRYKSENEFTGDGIPTLSNEQKDALEEIRLFFAEKDTVLLHGITASGKTEIYLHLIEDILKQGKQVLYLLPEIAITSQIIGRLQKAFGKRVVIYHSRCTDIERMHIWQRMSGDEPADIILGARSALFVPLQKPGLIIVDEEHETAFRQNDPAPRYNARDSAIVLAKLHGAKVLLGTATPAMETYYNAVSGRYGMVSLKQRFLNTPQPVIKIADMALARKRKILQGLFHPTLLDAIKNAMDNGEQVILFQNRRGFSPALQCCNCGHVPYCKYCNVSLTYHRAENKLVCHYCGYRIKIPARCPSCNEPDIKNIGSGTEQIEDEIRLIFPSARVARMDLDTTRSKTNYQKILGNMERGEIDILIGTQMVAKGLDFKGVTTVGILNADQLMNISDFRAYEKAFQLITQVSGRAGRRETQGKVIIQTYDIKNPVIKVIENQNDNLFMEKQLGERKEFGYPPFSRLIRVIFKHKDPVTVRKAAIFTGDILRMGFKGSRVIGPEAPVIDRINSYYIQHILIKTEKTFSVTTARSLVSKSINALRTTGGFSNVHVITEADPL